MSSDPDEGAIACTLAVGEQVERRRCWEELCRRSLIELTRTAEGVELRFAKNAIAEGELGRLVALERDCCAFARWAVGTDGGYLVLQVSARSDAVAAVHALFSTDEIQKFSS